MRSIKRQHRSETYKRVDEERIRQVVDPAKGLVTVNVVVRRFRPRPGAVSLKAFARGHSLVKRAGMWRGIAS